MASTFQLGDEQPSLKPTNLTKAAANSFNNLFGPPAPAKVDDDGDDGGGDDDESSHQLLQQPLWSFFFGGGEE